MMKFQNWRKKVTSILGAVCVCISLGSTALAVDFKIEAQTGGILYGLYPQIGASSVINAYWDATSAYAVTDGEYAYLGAILFVYAPGQVEESRPITVDGNGGLFIINSYKEKRRLGAFVFSLYYDLLRLSHNFFQRTVAAFDGVRRVAFVNATSVDTAVATNAFKAIEGG